MMKYCISKKENKIFSYLLDESGHTVEIRCDRPECQAALGNIYIGRVKNIAKNLQAAFVEVLPGLLCYLPLEDVKDPIYTEKGTSAKLQQGDELVVQISREAIKSKAPSVSTQICLQGTYAILDMAKTEVGVSRKLAEAQRQRLKEIGSVWLENRNMRMKLPGIVLRTNAGEASAGAVREELDQLMERLTSLRQKAPYRTCFSPLYETPSPWLKRLNGLCYHELDDIVLEDVQLYQEAEEYLSRENPQMLQKLQRYQDPLLPMEKLYSLEKRLQEALQQRVWMKSGAYLVIQPTEALTVVDVNTGKFEAGKQKEAAILKVNLEAARETARQLRLRNLSGIIIVDFINMKEETSRQQVMEELRRCLLQDPVLARVIDMTKLNLVEITRKKVERPLGEQVDVG